jgi:aspartyl aminopeptidase
MRRAGSIAAFVVGTAAPHEAGFRLIGAHTDSPNLRVKPVPDTRRAGYRQLAVEPYGGVLLHTWLDRDLSLAGRVTLRGDGGALSTRLCDFARPLLRIPSLAIHLDRTVNIDGLKLNAQTHMTPLLSVEDRDKPRSGLREALAAELSCEPHDVVSWDLCLYDTQPAALSGLQREFIHAARLDNLASCYSALQALCSASEPIAATCGIVLDDHEEVGSRSATGAASPFLENALVRVSEARGGGRADSEPRAIARSFLISADMAHAVHPNHSDKHEPGHRPLLGRGPVIKTNVNQAYASDAETSGRFAELCTQVDVVPQHFVVRSDLACGSTIGPISAGRIGIPTVDVGNPLLSMHSCREMAAADDVGAMQRVLDAFFAGK